MRQISDQSRARAIELIRVLRTPPHLPDEETDGPLSELEKILGYPGVSDLLFYEDPELPDEAVVDRALSYLPYGSEG